MNRKPVNEGVIRILTLPSGRPGWRAARECLEPPLQSDGAVHRNDGQVRTAMSDCTVSVTPRILIVHF